MSEWGRLQDVLWEEFDRQKVTGVDVNALIECIVNVRDFFPNLLPAAPPSDPAAPLREAAKEVVDFWDMTNGETTSSLIDALRAALASPQGGRP